MNKNILLIIITLCVANVSAQGAVTPQDAAVMAGTLLTNGYAAYVPALITACAGFKNQAPSYMPTKEAVLNGTKQAVTFAKDAVVKAGLALYQALPTQESVVASTKQAFETAKPYAIAAVQKTKDFFVENPKKAFVCAALVACVVMTPKFIAEQVKAMHVDEESASMAEKRRAHHLKQLYTIARYCGDGLAILGSVGKVLI